MFNNIKLERKCAMITNPNFLYILFGRPLIFQTNELWLMLGNRTICFVIIAHLLSLKMYPVKSAVINDLNESKAWGQRSTPVLLCLTVDSGWFVMVMGGRGRGRGEGGYSIHGG